jgi:hypothetical protein
MTSYRAPDPFLAGFSPLQAEHLDEMADGRDQHATDHEAFLARCVLALGDALAHGLDNVRVAEGTRRQVGSSWPIHRESLYEQLADIADACRPLHRNSTGTRHEPEEPVSAVIIEQEWGTCPAQGNGNEEPHLSTTDSPTACMVCGAPVPVTISVCVSGSKRTPDDPRGWEVRSMHPGSFRSGEWAKVYAVVHRGPDEGRIPCYLVTWPDLRCDLWACDDPSAEYEWRHGDAFLRELVAAMCLPVQAPSFVDDLRRQLDEMTADRDRVLAERRHETERAARAEAALRRAGVGSW